MSAGDQALPTRRELLRLFLDEKRRPEPFYQRLALRTVARLGFPVDGVRVLDLGSGPGHYAAALREAGAEVVGVELVRPDLAEALARGVVVAEADATTLPFPTGAFGGVFCSNLLEHTPDAGGVLAEVERVLRPGGWAWVSWTNWYSPWGGHEIVPYHYLGPKLGPAVHRRLRGTPAKNVPFDGLWPVHVGPVLRVVRGRPGLVLLDALPRYYPSQRWILSVPGLRELATWNCLLRLRRAGGEAALRPSGGP